MQTQNTVPALQQSEEISDSSHRQKWLRRRKELEGTDLISHVDGTSKRGRLDLVRILIKLLTPLLNLTGLVRRGRENAIDIQYKEIELCFPKLPEAFDGYRVLHLTDLHVDRLPDVIPKVLELVEGKTFDSVMMTGDYRDHHLATPEQIAPSMKLLISKLKTRDGVYAVLGNHDSHDFVNALESWGARTLVNESIQITRDNQSIWVTGTDDVNCFFTPEAPKALSATPSGPFKISLVHSAELYTHANKYGYSLYLCGHTHGGQICLPGEIALLTRQDTPRKYTKDLWQYDQLTGYTGRGTGVVGMDARFNSRGEATCFILRRGARSG